MSVKESQILIAEPENHGKLGSYVTGFVLSIICTIIPYFLVTEKLLRGGALVAALISFAALQLVIQLFFFLHLGRETKPRWKLVALLFAAMVVAILVIGSLWIMYNLNYNMMPSHEVDKHIMEEEGIYR